MQSESRYLVTIIDGVRIAEIASESVDFNDLTILPNHGVKLRDASYGIDWSPVCRDSSDHSVRIDVVRTAAAVDAGKCAKVCQHAVLPSERVLNEAVSEAVGGEGVGCGRIRTAGSDAPIVQWVCPYTDKAT